MTSKLIPVSSFIIFPNKTPSILFSLEYSATDISINGNNVICSFRPFWFQVPRSPYSVVQITLSVISNLYVEKFMIRIRNHDFSSVSMVEFVCACGASVIPITRYNIGKAWSVVNQCRLDFFGFFFSKFVAMNNVDWLKKCASYFPN